MVDFAGTRLLVTGGAGFIGSSLVDALLADGAERVVVVDTFFLGSETNLEEARQAYGDAVRIYREDAADRYAMQTICRRERPNVVFNLATKALLYSFFNPPGAFRINVDVAETLAELQRAGTYDRLVHVSSSEVYGSARTPRMAEDHLMLAETSYAAGKGAADLLFASYVNMFQSDIVIVRPFNNFGPRQNTKEFAGVVPLTVGRLMRGENPVIAGDGSQTRDFTFVADTVRSIMALGAAPEASGQLFNVGSGRETSIREIVDILCELFDHTGGVDAEPRRVADVDRHCADVTRAEQVIGPIALVGLREGLQQTIAWHERSAAPRS